ncbi:hypothetical protein RB195_010229 [Necator americanus]|uniref:Uncharacterized protein n=1 Tax=Necator americanus TaxID=51031 RepID=A0ABR1CWZ6_NECAM
MFDRFSLFKRSSIYDLKRIGKKEEWLEKAGYLVLKHEEKAGAAEVGVAIATLIIGGPCKKRPGLTEGQRLWQNRGDRLGSAETLRKSQRV